MENLEFSEHFTAEQFNQILAVARNTADAIELFKLGLTDVTPDRVFEVTSQDATDPYQVVGNRVYSSPTITVCGTNAGYTICVDTVETLKQVLGPRYNISELDETSSISALAEVPFPISKFQPVLMGALDKLVALDFPIPDDLPITPAVEPNPPIE